MKKDPSEFLKELLKGREVGSMCDCPSCRAKEDENGNRPEFIPPVIKTTVRSNRDKIQDLDLEGRGLIVINITEDKIDSNIQGNITLNDIANLLLHTFPSICERLTNPEKSR